VKSISLDPRLNRVELEEVEEKDKELIGSESHWITYEVFHQKKRGIQHQHVCIPVSYHEEV